MQRGNSNFLGASSLPAAFIPRSRCVPAEQPSGEAKGTICGLGSHFNEHDKGLRHVFSHYNQ